jgi:glutamyl-tRNA reductase
MHLLSLGISHHTAPVELRERLSLSPERLKEALAQVGPSRTGGSCLELSEMAIISTCNRLELYALSLSPEFDDIHQFLAEATGVGIEEFAPFAVTRSGPEAISHLFRVAAGLDSMVLGETQILGQVTSAYDLWREYGAIGPVISALFRAAIHAGKRAHTDTAISRNPGSVSSVAARLAAEKIGDISEAKVVVIGAGEMAELAVEALRHRDAKNITVVNRTRERAEELAARWDASALGFDRIAEALESADIVVTSTGAPHVIVTTELAREAMAKRPGRPLIFIDIAVPRDVDPAVNEVANAHCYDIDDLEARLQDSLAERREAVPAVEAIIAEETREFIEYLNSLDVVPVVTALRAKAEEIRRVETEKTLRHLSHLAEEDRARIEFLARSVLNRFLHEPTLRLKAVAGQGKAADYADAVRHIFDLTGDGKNGNCF